VGPWASVVVAVAAVAAVFFAVMGYRGLLETMENFSGRCITCARTTVLPLPERSRECWRCHYALVMQRLTARLSMRH
jgi:hypothetical protein